MSFDARSAPRTVRKCANRDPFVPMAISYLGSPQTLANFCAETQVHAEHFLFFISLSMLDLCMRFSGGLPNPTARAVSSGTKYELVQTLALRALDQLWLTQDVRKNPGWKLCTVFRIYTMDFAVCAHAIAMPSGRCRSAWKSELHFNSTLSNHLASLASPPILSISRQLSSRLLPTMLSIQRTAVQKPGIWGATATTLVWCPPIGK